MKFASREFVSFGPPQASSVRLPGWTRRRVILYEDGIELLGVFANRKLKRSEILGRRMAGTDPRNARGGAHYVMVPVDKAVRVLRLPPYLNMDEDFRAWMDRIPKISKSEGAKS